ncbi:unnamed protein product, partial [Notodromas monacha]
SIGDLIVLTKPLGTQVAVNAFKWYCNPIHPKLPKLKEITSFEEVCEAYESATASMIRLNRIGAKLMKKYGATAATDVTGFGILGHADNLAKSQIREVTFIIK